MRIILYFALWVLISCAEPQSNSVQKDLDTIYLGSKNYILPFQSLVYDIDQPRLASLKTSTTNSTPQLDSSENQSQSKPAPSFKKPVKSENFKIQIQKLEELIEGNE